MDGVDARSYLSSLVGSTIRTVSGAPNEVVGLDGANVLVRTRRSAPDAAPVPVDSVQQAIDQLQADGEVEVSVSSLGYRSAFLGAVLATLPGTRVVAESPPRIERVPGDLS